VTYLQEISGKDLEPIHGPVRPGDVPHSKAAIDKAMMRLDYHPEVKFKEGLEVAYNWYLNN
jgi:UDP-N-acetylglucosamine 4-epimerase